MMTRDGRQSSEPNTVVVFGNQRFVAWAVL